jgi:hypothetical protein
MLMIRTLRRVPGVLPLTRWLADSAASVIIIVSFLVFSGVHNTIHVAVALAVREVVIHAEAGSSTRTATLAFVVPRESITTSESAATLEAGVWPFASVQFRVAFQIVQTAEPGLARGTFVRLFLAVGQKMALEIVVPRKVSRAIRALVSLGRRRLRRVLAVPWQTHLTSRGPRIRLWREGARERECAIPGVVARIWRDELVVMLLMVLWLLGRAFLCGAARCARARLVGVSGCASCRIVTET